MNYNYTFNLKERNADKPTLIYLRASIPGDRKYLKYSTGEKIHPENWDFDNQFPIRMRGRSTKAVQINSVINQLTRYAEAFQVICSRLEAQEQALKTDQIRAELDYRFKKSAQSPSAFFPAYDEMVKEKEDLGEITQGTINRYKSIKRMLEEFSKNKNYTLTFNSINDQFYVQFINYSRTVLKHQNNTLGRNIGFVKTFMNWSASRNYHNNFTFRNFTKPSSDTDEIALTQKELDALWEYDFSEIKRLERVRDVFVFGCATGMRYSDYSRINKNNVRDGFIHINTQKQKSNLGIPLNKYSKAVLEKYDYNLPIISDQKFRDYIKEACKKVGFTEDTIKTSFIGNKRLEKVIPKHDRISTHTARRTFITLSLEKGMRPDVVMSITGHRSYSSFKKYIKQSKQVRGDEMIKAWN